MAGNSFGALFKVTSFGESHGKALGVVLDGVPAKLPFNYTELLSELKRRSPGQHLTATNRKEDDLPIVLSGIMNDLTLGTPIAINIENNNQKSEDYDKLKNNFRPGHGDKTTQDKYGIRDHRGGGRASGRETVSRVIAGYFAGLILPSNIAFNSFITKIGKFEIPATENDTPRSYFHTTNDMAKELTSYLVNLKNQGESCGGEITLFIKNPPMSLGDPVFDKLKATLAHAMLSIGSCMSFELGLGVDFSGRLGSEVSTDQKNFGGIEGGISNGETIKIRLTFKAPSTIGENAKEGRHDPCILPRALVVVEAMAKMTLADHYLRHKAIT